MISLNSYRKASKSWFGRIWRPCLQVSWQSGNSSSTLLLVSYYRCIERSCLAIFTAYHWRPKSPSAKVHAKALPMTEKQAALWIKDDMRSVLLQECKGCKAANMSCQKMFIWAACFDCAYQKSRCDMVEELTDYWALERILVSIPLNGILPSGEFL